MKSFKKFEEFVGPGASGSAGRAGPTGLVGYSTHSTTAYSESKLPILEDLELIPINKKPTPPQSRIVY